jgi:excisionase family DNA binding protein
MPDDLMTVYELAAKLRFKPPTIYAWAREGRIPAYRLSARGIRFSLSEVIAALGVDTESHTARNAGADP